MADHGFGAIEQMIRAALAKQGFMQLVGAEVVEIARGKCVMALARRPEVLQQNGFVHGGAVAFLVDNATTCAAATMIERADQGCLTAEYKLNFVSPAVGDRVVCEALMVKPGRRISTVEAKVYSESPDGRKLCAVALATIAIVDRQSAA